MFDDCSDEDDAEDRCRTSIEKAIEADKENPEALQMMASFLLLKEKNQVCQFSRILGIRQFASFKN